MNAITRASTPTPITLPAPRVEISIRPATMDDLPFIDTLQKAHSKQLGFLHRKALEGKIEAGQVLIAEEAKGERGKAKDPEAKGERGKTKDPESDSFAFGLSPLASPLGYLIASDRYLRRDELGVIYQLCVVPGERRKLVAGALLKAQFDRSAYGCRLYCCWCAQDLAANHFWESMGFVPIAFRGGSDRKKRVHIYWQKRIRAGDETTPWWFPAKTEGGAMREDRLVLPIPPHLHWSDPMPVLQPTPAPDAERDTPAIEATPTQRRSGGAAPCPKLLSEKPSNRSRAPRQWGGPDEDEEIIPEPQPAPAVETQPESPKPKRSAPPCDPRLIAAARELRDRYLEQVNADPGLLTSNARYDVARLPEPEAPHAMPSVPLLEEAA